MTIFVRDKMFFNVLSGIFPWTSIITMFLLTSKLFSKKTSICWNENKFLSCCSNASWFISLDGNKISFRIYVFPIGLILIWPIPRFKIPDPLIISKAISGTTIAYLCISYKSYWFCMINGTEKYSDWYCISLDLNSMSEF